MFRVGKSSKADAPEQAKPAPQPAPPQQSAPAAQQPPLTPRPQPAPAATVAPETRPAQFPTPQGASAPQPQQPRAQVESQTLTSRAVSESEALARSLKEGAVGGFVGGTSTLSGEINFRGMMRVDGKVSGRIASQDGTLIVSSGGRVEAEVSVLVAKVSGEVVGDITAAERVELGRTARVAGNIETPALVVEEGAIFEGNCRMSRRREGGRAEEAQRSKTAA